MSQPAEAALPAALAAYLDHVQADPGGWRLLLAATSGDLKAVADEVADHSRRKLLETLELSAPTPALRAALDGWAAFEQAACLVWLDTPGLERATLEDLFMTTFLASVGAASKHEEPPTADGNARTSRGVSNRP